MYFWSQFFIVFYSFLFISQHHDLYRHSNLYFSPFNLILFFISFIAFSVPSNRFLPTPKLFEVILTNHHTSFIFDYFFLFLVFINLLFYFPLFFPFSFFVSSVFFFFFSSFSVNISALSPSNYRLYCLSIYSFTF